jgi:hypothetical protein
MAERFENYRQFWPFYLAEHSRPGTRALHYLGTGAGLLLLALALLLGDWRLLAGALIAGYGFAWAGHALIEGNKPATFRHPIWSLISDFRMAGLWVSGRLGAELERQGIARNLDGPSMPPSS